MKKISIKDIAEISGVSIATVSRVLNNNGRFSQETKEKILRIVEETGYETNYNAKSLRSNRTFVIGIILPDISNYFFANLVKKIENNLFKMGYSTIIANTDKSINKETNYYSMMLRQNVDGIIVISSDNKNESVLDSNIKIPTIYIDRRPSNKENTFFVSSNHYQGGYDAASILVKKGCHNPAIFINNSTNPTTIDRVNGFSESLANLKKLKNFKPLSFSLTSIPNKESDFFNWLKSNEVDGIFAINDQLAVSLIDTIKNYDFELLNSLKITGFDNDPVCNLVTPSISSFKHDTTTIALKAIELLFEISKNNISTDKNFYDEILVPVTFVDRDSTN